MEPRAALVDSIDFFRLDANRKLRPDRRSDLGQFMTPPATARLMAKMFDAGWEEICLLDAGAGVGSLTAAFISEVCTRAERPKKITATAYEVDAILVEYLEGTLEQCRTTCANAGIAFDYELFRQDESSIFVQLSSSESTRLSTPFR
jgi:adenine-specific DNA-methyltransferase